MNYYLARDYKAKNIHTAGSKARRDIEQIMEGMGFRPAGCRPTVSKSRLLHFIRTIAIAIRVPGKLRRGDVLVMQYPTKYYSLLCRLAHRRGAQVVSFVHDLGCFRQKYNSEKKEMRLLNRSDALIGCNPTVCRWMADKGFVGHSGKKVLVPLHAFDFLSGSASPDRKSTWPLRKVVYAGQLARRKNKFLYDLGRYADGYTVNVYGKGFDASQAANPEKFETKGFMLPDELIRRAEGDFGLVWDGESLDCCSGDWGGYLILNTPHKVSLYIRCGLPLIIWRKAAMAAFVEENGIGIGIDSLRDISNIYAHLTQEEYHRLCDNVQRVNRQMAGGQYFRRAVSEAVSRLDGQ